MSILTDDAVKLGAQVMLLAGLSGAVVIPAAKWLRTKITESVRDQFAQMRIAELEPLRRELTKQGEALAIITDAVGQLQKNGGSTLRDEIDHIRKVVDRATGTPPPKGP